MSFIARHIVGPRERIVYLTRLHWITLVSGFGWALLFFVLALLWDRFTGVVPPPETTVLRSYQVAGISLGTPARWLFCLLVAAGSWMFALHFLKVLSSEVALTPTRLIYKRGLIFVQVEEVDLKEIKGEQVNHGWFGAWLGYGRVYFDSRFTGDTHLPAIQNPHKLLSITHRLTQAPVGAPVADQPAV